MTDSSMIDTCDPIIMAIEGAIAATQAAIDRDGPDSKDRHWATFERIRAALLKCRPDGDRDTLAPVTR